MVNLLMRFYDVQGGEIRIDGTPIQSLPRENVRSLFCMVLQDTWLFEGTIKENIVYAKQGVSDEEVISACKAVGPVSYTHLISQVFNAETFIIGCCAGLLGIGISLLLTIPINAILQNLLGAATLTRCV